MPSWRRVRQNWKERAAILRAVLNADAELASVLALCHVQNAAPPTPTIDDKTPGKVTRCSESQALKADCSILSASTNRKQANTRLRVATGRREARLAPTGAINTLGSSTATRAGR